MNLSSGLEIRSTPCVASSASSQSIAAFARSDSAEDIPSFKNGHKDTSNGHIEIENDHENTNNENGFNLGKNYMELCDKIPTEIPCMSVEIA